MFGHDPDCDYNGIIDYPARPDPVDPENYWICTCCGGRLPVFPDDDNVTMPVEV